MVALAITLAIGIAMKGIQYEQATCIACGWFSSNHDHSDNGDNSGSDDNSGNSGTPQTVEPAVAITLLINLFFGFI